MSIRRIALVTGIFVLVIVLIRILWHVLLEPPEYRAIRGELDLRGYELTQNSVIKLNGEWEFYPGELAMDNKSVLSRPEKTFIQVPGDWRASVSKEGSPFGYGTYRLRIQVDPADDVTYGLYITNARSSSELYVNGRLVGAMGKPAPTERQYSPSSRTYTAAFKADNGIIDLVLQVANFDSNLSGGLREPVKFGHMPAVGKERQFSSDMQLILGVVLLIHALYALILYIVGIRNNGLFSFFLLVLSALVMTLFGDDRMILDWIPAFSFEWATKLLLLSFYAVGFFMLWMARSLLTEHAEHNVFRWLPWIYAVAALAIMLPSTQHAYNAFILFGSLNWISGLLFLAFALYTTMKTDKDAIYLVLGLVAILTNMLGANIKLSLGLGYYPVDLIVAFLAFASFWFKRYFRISSETARLAEKLQRADKLKDDFLANTSHELRNPLHGMLNMAQTVLETGIPEQDVKNKENMKLLISVGKRMSYMLNDLLDMTRLQENGIRLEQRSVRVQGIASGVIDMLRFMTEGKPIRFINAIPANFPNVSADENRLTQILFNLLHNAVKFTIKGHIAISAGIRNGMAEIVVEDTGIGMDASTQQRIFAPYEQGDSGITAIGGGGIGLGLSLCQQLVELHGGTLRVSSEPGEGSSFRFTLPLSAPGDRQAERASIAGISAGLAEKEVAVAIEPVDGSLVAESAAGSDRSNILVIDDDAVNLNILSSLLVSANHNVVTAASGAEAIALLDTREWDLIVTDIMMPNMSGYELTRFVRERFSLPELPILLLTARGRPEDIEAGFLAGANDYLTKPVDGMELKSRVRALTDLKRILREKLRMEAAWLQAQIQPHFLYNTLNSISALSEIDNDKMTALLETFGQYLRASFDYRNLERLVPLERELSLVRSYVYIEKERFEDRLTVCWEIEENLDLRVPPLSIQTLVENAIRHGLLSRDEGGEIRIRIADNGQEAEISIADNGVGMDAETFRRVLVARPGANKGIGLFNTNRRLKQLFGKGLQIRSAPDQGTVISFVVPK